MREERYVTLPVVVENGDKTGTALRVNLRRCSCSSSEEFSHHHRASTTTRCFEFLNRCGGREPPHTLLIFIFNFFEKKRTWFVFVHE